MNKKLLVAAVAAALTLSTAQALAATPDISGDFQSMIQTQKDSSDYADMRIRLNFDQNLGDNMYVHGRLMGIDDQNGPVGTMPAGTGSTGAYVNMEQMYLGAKIGAVDMKLGRQPLYLGKGLLADINGIEGLSLTAATGNTTLAGTIARSSINITNNFDALVPNNDDIFAVNAGTKLDGVNLGASYLDKRKGSKYWGVNADAKVADNVTLAGEYVRNNIADANGFLVKATVGQAAKKGEFNYAVSYRNVKANAVDGNWTTNGAFADSKGFRVEANYKVTDNANIWLYQDITQQNSDPSYHPNQARAELDVNF